MSVRAFDAWIVRRLMEGPDVTSDQLARVSPSIREAAARLAATPYEDRGRAFGVFLEPLPDHAAFIGAMHRVDPDGPPPEIGEARPMERPAFEPSPDDAAWLDGMSSVLHRHEAEAAHERFGTPLPEPEPEAPPSLFDKLNASLSGRPEPVSPVSMISSKRDARPEPEPAPTAGDDADDLDRLDDPAPSEPDPEPDGPPVSSPCDVAAWLLDRGFRPVPTLGKNPGCVGGDWGSRTYTPRTFRDVFTSSHADGLGIRLGPGMGPGGVWLADMECDGPEGGESLRKLFGGDPPDTLGWGSTRGPHRLYAVDRAFADALATLAGKADGSGTYHFEGLPGLEIRVGGLKPDGSPKALQSVCPPSRGTDGRPREWIGPPTVATIPPDVVERLKRAAARRTAERTAPRPEPASRPSTAFGATAGDSRPAYGRSALDGECRAVATEPAGGRNDRLNVAACKMGSLVAAGALDESEAVAALADAARACGLDDREAAATIRSGMEAGKASPRDMTNVGTRAATSGPRPAPEPPPADSWGEPKPIRVDLPAVQPMRPELIPEPFRPWLADTANRMGCPPDFPVVAALAALAIVVGRRIAIRPKRRDNWTVVANLWGALIGVPSAFKSPSLEAGVTMLRRLAARAAEAYRAGAASRKAAKLAADAKADAAQKALDKAARAGGDDAELAALAAAVVAAEATPEPPEPEYYTSNATPEAMAVLMANRPEGVGEIRDELIGMIRGLDRQGREEERAFRLECWNGNGSEHVCHRIGRPKVRIPNPCLTTVGCMTIGPLKALVRETAKGEKADDGFLPRFQLAVWPDGPEQWTNVDEWPDSPAKNRAFAIYEFLDAATPAALGAERDPDHADAIPFLRFDADGQEAFNAWRTTLENRLLSPSMSPLLNAHLSKYRSLMPSLALLFHLCDVADGRAAPGPVSAAAARLAVQWCEYLETHAVRVYSAATQPDMEAARALADKIMDGKLPSPFAPRDVYRRHWAGLDDRDAVQRAVAALEDLGWVRAVETPTAGAPREDVYIHPKLPRAPEKNSA